MEIFKERLDSLGIKTWLIKKYMDDILVIVSNLPIGTRYTDGKLNHSKEGETQDKEKNRTASEVTMDVLKQIANDIIPFLEFTTEVSNGEEEPVPCLDSQLWFGTLNRQAPWFSHQKTGEVVPGSGKPEGPESYRGVGYRFYKKKVSNPITILQCSAMPESVKRATFSSEVLRRLKTTHTNLEKEKVEDILLTFSDELNAMGYSEEWVRDTLKSAMVGYMRILHRDLEGEGPRNRKGRDTLKSRRFKRYNVQYKCTM